MRRRQGAGVESLPGRRAQREPLAFGAAIPGRENRPGRMTWPFSITSTRTRGGGCLGHSSATIHLNMAKHRFEERTGAGGPGGAKGERQRRQKCANNPHMGSPDFKETAARSRAPQFGLMAMVQPIVVVAGAMVQDRAVEPVAVKYWSAMPHHALVP